MSSFGGAMSCAEASDVTQQRSVPAAASARSRIGFTDCLLVRTGFSAGLGRVASHPSCLIARGGVAAGRFYWICHSVQAKNPPRLPHPDGVLKDKRMREARPSRLQVQTARQILALVRRER